jgi:polar amino acid transport system substrate-binding protein
MRTRPSRVAALLAVAGIVAACTGAAATPSPLPPTEAPTQLATDAPTQAPTDVPTEAPSESPSAAPSVAVSPSAAPTVAASPSPSAVAVSEECQAANLGEELKNAPRLTLSTDIPAYPPWWGGDPATQYPNEPAGAPEWELSDPYSMEGYESAVAYAVAEKLGFAPEEVDWVPNASFAQAFAPGEKPFDFHLAQVSIRPRRAEAVDFSTSYLDANQAIIALTPNPITGAATIEDLKGYRLGAAANTTSFELIENVVQPTTEAQVFDDNAGAIIALQNGQIDGLVVDVNTAIYIRDAELEDFETPDPEATIVGQFADTEQVDEVGLVLEKGSPLTACVNEALAAMQADGTLQAIYDEWISAGQEIPFFE